MFFERSSSAEICAACSPHQHQPALSQRLLPTARILAPVFVYHCRLHVAPSPSALLGYANEAMMRFGLAKQVAYTHSAFCTCHISLSLSICEPLTLAGLCTSLSAHISFYRIDWPKFIQPLKTCQVSIVWRRRHLNLAFQFSNADSTPENGQFIRQEFQASSQSVRLIIWPCEVCMNESQLF